MHRQQAMNKKGAKFHFCIRNDLELKILNTYVLNVKSNLVLNYFMVKNNIYIDFCCGQTFRV